MGFYRSCVFLVVLVAIQCNYLSTAQCVSKTVAYVPSPMATALEVSNMYADIPVQIEIGSSWSFQIFGADQDSLDKYNLSFMLDSPSSTLIVSVDMKSKCGGSDEVSSGSLNKINGMIAIVGCLLCSMFITPMVSKRISVVMILAFAVAIASAATCSGTRVVITVPAGTRINSPTTGSLKNTKRCDVIVGGAGVAGIFTAYNLAKNGSKVCIFEKEANHSGRFLDVFFSQIGNAEPAGLGAWRFDSSHDFVEQLLSQLNISHRDWTKQPTLWEARQHFATSEEQLRADAFPSLQTLWPNKTSQDFWDMMIDDTNATRAKYVDMLSYVNGKFRSEAFDFLQATNAGFKGDFYKSNPNRYFEYLKYEYEDSGIQNRPIGGMSAITRALVAQNELLSNKFSMDLKEPILSITRKGTEYRVETPSFVADTPKLVLSLPPYYLSQVEGDVIADITSQPIFHSVITEPVFKAAMLFPTAWWEPELQPLSLYQTLSSCLGMVLPYRDPGSNGALLHVAYSDGPCAYNHWGILVDQLTPTQMADHIMEELKFLFPNKTLPEPIETVYHFWQAGWHWQSTEDHSLVDVQNWASNPLPNDPSVFLVGESYAVRRTWAEGALHTSNNALSKGWGINAFH